MTALWACSRRRPQIQLHAHWKLNIKFLESDPVNKQSIINIVTPMSASAFPTRSHTREVRYCSQIVPYVTLNLRFLKRSVHQDH